MEVSYAALTDVGKKRDHNEDAFLCDEDVDLFAVCDGMGGHAAGEVASAIAVQTLREAIEQNLDALQSYRAGEVEVERYEVTQMMEHAIQTACDRIYEAAQQDDKKRGMGTTCSMLMIIGNRGFIGHVGDSRIYLIREGMIHQLTEDHSLVNELVRRGKLKRDEVAGSPYAEYKNAVTRAVGVYPSVEGDTLDFDVLPGDQFMLCSDGLHAYLDDDKIRKAFDQDALEQVVKDFIDLANEGGGHDNITSVAVRVAEQEDDEEHEERLAEFNLTIEMLRQIPIFKYATYKELVHVMNITEVLDFHAGETVFAEGDEGEYLFVVMKGGVSLRKGGTTITTFEPGQHFGEMALVDKAPRSTTVVATEDSRLLGIHRTNFYKMVRLETGLSVKILWSFVQVLADRLRATTRSLSEARMEAEAEDLTGEVDLEEETTATSTPVLRAADPFPDRPAVRDTIQDGQVPAVAPLPTAPTPGAPPPAVVPEAQAPTAATAPKPGEAPPAPDPGEAPPAPDPGEAPPAPDPEPAPTQETPDAPAAEAPKPDPEPTPTQETPDAPSGEAPKPDPEPAPTQETPDAPSGEATKPDPEDEPSKPEPE